MRVALASGVNEAELRGDDGAGGGRRRHTRHHAGGASTGDGDEAAAGRPPRSGKKKKKRARSEPHVSDEMSNPCRYKSIASRNVARAPPVIARSRRLPVDPGWSRPGSLEWPLESEPPPSLSHRRPPLPLATLVHRLLVTPLSARSELVQKHQHLARISDAETRVEGFGTVDTITPAPHSAPRATRETHPRRCGRPQVQLRSPCAYPYLRAGPAPEKKTERLSLVPRHPGFHFETLRPRLF